jgi:hypothetical protein
MANVHEWKRGQEPTAYLKNLDEPRSEENTHRQTQKDKKTDVSRYSLRQQSGD